MSKKVKSQQNYLEKIPKRSPKLAWKTDDEGIITLEIENKGFFNTIAQKLFKKPKISYIHLDSWGSFLWPIIDGETDITALGVKVKEHFGEEAEPLYPRLVKYFQILNSYGFVVWQNEE